MSTKREIRFILLDVNGVPVAERGPSGAAAAFNANSGAPLAVKVEISCDMGWHTLQVLPLKNFD